MTDKQIIIHGVDVSGCNRLNTFPMQYGEPHEICLTSLEQWGGQEKYCKDRPNCYYKQLEKLKAENLGFKILHESDKDLLKRKEQECEELKKWLPIVTRLENEFENFEKAKAIDYKSYIEQIFIELDQLKSENKHLNDLLNQALKDCEKAMQTLTEIKEFFNEECIICKENYINITGEICEECKYKQILQKISECEGNDVRS